MNYDVYLHTQTCFICTTQFALSWPVRGRMVIQTGPKIMG